MPPSITHCEELLDPALIEHRHLNDPERPSAEDNNSDEDIFADVVPGICDGNIDGSLTVDPGLALENAPASSFTAFNPANDRNLSERLKDNESSRIRTPANRTPTSSPPPPQKRRKTTDPHPFSTKKLSNEQRARNAANHRHHKLRDAPTNNHPTNESIASSSDQEKQNAISRQRESNRIAAAKCRVKKKAERDEIEQLAREQVVVHEQLAQDVQWLRNQKSFLRTQMLEHNPDVCTCTGIHQVNAREAQNLAFLAAYQVAGFDLVSFREGKAESTCKEEKVEECLDLADQVVNI